jgi:hypothetical protein
VAAWLANTNVVKLATPGASMNCSRTLVQLCGSNGGATSGATGGSGSHADTSATVPAPAATVAPVVRLVVRNWRRVSMPPS